MCGSAMVAVGVPVKYMSFPYCDVALVIEQDDTTGRLRILKYEKKGKREEKNHSNVNYSFASALRSLVFSFFSVIKDILIFDSKDLI